MGVGSGRARAEASEHRLSCTAVRALLAAARGSTLSRPHAGCTQGACMLGGLILAYSAHSARISRPLVMACPPCRTRSDRRSHDSQRQCLHRLNRIGTYTCMPYVYNSSQDVEKCALDLVSSSSTHTNTVQAIAVASKGACFFLFEPLQLASQHIVSVVAGAEVLVLPELSRARLQLPCTAGRDRMRVVPT